MKLTFDNFQAEITGSFKDFVTYLALKNSLPKPFEGARIGCICATVLKDDSIQLIKRVGLREKNNGKIRREIRDGWEYFEPFKPSKVVVLKTRIKYYTKKYLHKNLFIQNNNVTLQYNNGVIINKTGLEIWDILKNFRSIVEPPKPEEPNNCPF